MSWVSRRKDLCPSTSRGASTHGRRRRQPPMSDARVSEAIAAVAPDLCIFVTRVRGKPARGARSGSVSFSRAWAVLRATGSAGTARSCAFATAGDTLSVRDSLSGSRRRVGRPVPMVARRRGRASSSSRATPREGKKRVALRTGCRRRTGRPSRPGAVRRCCCCSRRLVAAPARPP